MPQLTDRAWLRGLCQRYGITPSKGFGQNFIVNPSLCPRICEAAGVRGANVLEIGPGVGTLTRDLAARAKKVVALELDKRLIPLLGETLAGCDNVVLRQGDALKVDLTALLAEEFDGPAILCANLPYNITSPLIMRLLEERLPLERLTVMVQREAAERIIADPGTRGAGAISYAVSYYARPRFEFSVPPGNFEPPPKVTSSVISLEVDQRYVLPPMREARLFRLVRAAFSQRRKTLANAASAGLALPKTQLLDALEAAGIDVRARPEQLTLEDFIKLEETLFPHENKDCVQGD